MYWSEPSLKRTPKQPLVISARERPSDQMSDNRHRQRWTPADVDGRCFPGRTCRCPDSPPRDLASGRRGRRRAAEADRSSCAPVVCIQRRGTSVPERARSPAVTYGHRERPPTWARAGRLPTQNELLSGRSRPNWYPRAAPAEQPGRKVVLRGGAPAVANLRYSELTGASVLLGL